MLQEGVNMNGFVPTVAAAAIAAALPIANARNNGTGYHLVYTASTGCGDVRENYRHNLRNIDYINTNYWSHDPKRAVAVTPPQDQGGRAVPGTEIAYVGKAGNDPKQTGSQLGLDLYKTYNLNALSSAVVLVYVNDPKDRTQDRIVQRFETTAPTDFYAQVAAAVRADQETQATQKQQGAER
jgi:hypothetical protein